MRGATEPRTRILIVDDHPIVREGLCLRIASQSDMEVCAEAADVATALAKVQEHAPDLAIVDIALGDGSGLDLIRQLKARACRTRILVLSAHDDALYAERAIRAGGQGYISKTQAQGRILEALAPDRDAGAG